MYHILPYNQNFVINIPFLSKNILGVTTISGNDYIKFLTEQITSYIDLDPQDRKQKRLKRKEHRSNSLDRWLGVLPLMVKIHMKK